MFFFLKKNIYLAPFFLISNIMTTIRQLSVFLENKSGRLHEILSALGNENINLTALTVADTSEYGILRLLVSDPEKGYHLLKSLGYRVSLTEVIAVSISHQAGSLAKALKDFSEKDLSIEFIYAFSLGEKAIVVLRTENHLKAMDIIERNNLTLINEEEIKHL